MKATHDVSRREKAREAVAWLRQKGYVITFFKGWWTLTWPGVDGQSVYTDEEIESYARAFR